MSGVQGSGVGPAVDEHAEKIDAYASARNSQIAGALRAFARRRSALVGLAVLLLIIAFTVITPFLWKYSYSDITVDFSAAPGWRHPFGTDSIGHDLFAQTLRGIATSLKVATLVALLSTVVGTVVGAVAGYFGRAWDAVLMRVADLIMTIPVLAITLVLANVLGAKGSSWFLLSLVLSAVLWIPLSRLVRGTLLSLMKNDYIDAARMLGASDRRIIIRHLLPNAAGPIIVDATLMVGRAIIVAASMEYLGLGIQAPEVSLGLLIQRGQGAATTQPWLFGFPALFLVLIILSVNFVGDGLRDALDPRRTV
ncbi:ABC transporter permease [Microlunatus endophyticus]|uniref:Oligopeptide transport system permease protein OppC n=1 Tax=Microlunatus endophyticus TaxID=1716077 RepID=A0A917SEH7_9ACTN|nr:ABC transporter permease [Microlunatus endophyticus]GGL73733.1 ABC transporter permease [Microlunatus endophyticus]